MDRATLDVALELGVPCGGWCPSSRKAEDGPLDPRYPLTDTPTDDYAQRTEWNVRDSHGTLVLHRGTLTGGTAYTVACAVRLGRPHLVLDLTHDPSAVLVHAWIHQREITILNVAGPRESTNPGIYAQAAAFLRIVLSSH